MPDTADQTLQSLGRLRLTGLLEGVSYLLLLGVAMPLKYLAGLPLAVRVTGLVHGLLFIAFLVALAHAASLAGWSLRRIAGAIVAAIVPFGTFVLDRRLRDDEARLRGERRARAA